MSDSQDNKKKRRFNRVRWILFSLFAIPLLALAVESHLNSKSLEKELDVSSVRCQNARLEMLRTEERNRDLIRKEGASRFQREQLSSIYRKYRDIDDFAPNPSALIVFAVTQLRETNDTLHFSVPKGQHVFSFQLTKTDFASKEILDTKKLDFPIAGPGGFRVTLDLPIEKGAAYRDPRQLTLNIESNNDSFQSVSKNLLQPFPPPSGSSAASNYVRTKPVAFPNQIESWPTANGGGLLLNTMRWSIKENESRYNLDFEMRLQSDGPEVAPASRWYHAGKAVFTYAGSGKYIVKQNEEPSDN